jgi:hypothetical protein
MPDVSTRTSRAQGGASTEHHSHTGTAVVGETHWTYTVVEDPYATGKTRSMRKLRPVKLIVFWPISAGKAPNSGRNI